MSTERGIREDVGKLLIWPRNIVPTGFKAAVRFQDFVVRRTQPAASGGHPPVRNAGYSIIPPSTYSVAPVT